MAANKSWILSSILLSALLLGACGNSEKASEDKKTKEEEKPKMEETASDTEKDVSKEEKDKTEVEENGSEGEALNPYIEGETGGKSEILYTNDNPGFESDENGFKVTVDKYQIAKVTDMDQSSANRFDGSTSGYIITALMTVDNQSGKPVYFNGTTNIRLQDELTYVPSNTRDFIEEGKGLRPKTYEAGLDGNTNMYEDGEKTSGLITYKMTEDQYNMMTGVKPKFVMESSASQSKDFKGSGEFMPEKIFDFTYSGEQAEASASAPQFYPDSMTTDNIADKKMIFEKNDINKTEKIEDAVDITLDGVQYAEVIPTAGNEARFGEDEMVALTVKTTIKNNTDKELNLFNLSSKVTIDEDRGYTRNNGFAEPSEPKKVKAGEEAERYFVFLFRKDEFQLFKQFDMEIGPFFGEKEYLFGEKTVNFELPR